MSMVALKGKRVDKVVDWSTLKSLCIESKGYSPNIFHRKHQILYLFGGSKHCLYYGSFFGFVNKARKTIDQCIKKTGMNIQWKSARKMKRTETTEQKRTQNKETWEKFTILSQELAYMFSRGCINRTQALYVLCMCIHMPINENTIWCICIHV